MKTIVILAMIGTSCICHSQTGPGGIGAVNGLTDLVLWLKADLGVEEASLDAAENNDLITTWKDQSGVGNDAIASNSPTFQTNQYNGFPAVNFDGVNDVLSLDGSLLPLGNVGRTYIVVAQAIETGGQNVMSYGQNTIRRRISITHSATESSVAVGGTNWGDQFTTSTGLRTNTITFPDGGGSNSFSLFTNAGPLVESYIAGGFYSVNTYPDYAYIGSDITVASFFGGDICEIIVYDKVLNSAEFIIIQNYISAKYNLPVAVNDIYDQDDVGNGNYDYDVAGIGRTNASNISADGQGSGIVRILNASGLGDNEYLLWGNDNGALAATETTDIPSGMDARLGRTWRVSEVNSSGGSVDVGSIDLQFDLTGLGSIVTTDLRLLIDTDNDGVFSDETAISGASSLGSNVYAFTGVSAISDNIRFTIGTIDAAQTPLPVELVNFNAVVKTNNTVQLSWQTISELNNEKFTVQKSMDANQWSEIVTLDGAGNSSVVLNYIAVDTAPFTGTSYYRIKQSDFNGDFSYSHVKAVSIEVDGIKEIYISPNPTHNSLKIEAVPEVLSDLKFFNSLGIEVSHLIHRDSYTGASATFNLSELSSGVFWVKTKYSVYKIVKE
jgi:hypothetical protein